MRRRSISESLTDISRDNGKHEDGLSPSTFFSLLRSLGPIHLSAHQKEELEDRLAHCETNDSGNLNFVGFLRIMRWLLDTYFASIKTVPPKATGESLEQYFKE